MAGTNAADCEHSTCPALWRHQISGAMVGSIGVGGADANTVFVTATIRYPTAERVGVIERLSAVTNKVQWSATLPEFPGSPVRIGNTVWLISHADTLVGFSTTATKATPLRSIKVTVNSLHRSYAAKHADDLANVFRVQVHGFTPLLRTGTGRCQE